MDFVCAGARAVLCVSYMLDRLCADPLIRCEHLLAVFGLPPRQIFTALGVRRSPVSSPTLRVISQHKLDVIM